MATKEPTQAEQEILNERNAMFEHFMDEDFKDQTEFTRKDMHTAFTVGGCTALLQVIERHLQRVADEVTE